MVIYMCVWHILYLVHMQYASYQNEDKIQETTHSKNWKYLGGNLFIVEPQDILNKAPGIVKHIYPSFVGFFVL